jgi:protein-S-isoprenylcysteine O-methyltransferase
MPWISCPWSSNDVAKGCVLEKTGFHDPASGGGLMISWYHLFVASYIAWIVMEVWIFRRDRRKSSGASGDRGSLIVLVVMLTISLTGAWYAAAALPFARIVPVHFQLFLIGLALIWAGMALRIWAILVLGRFFRTTVFVQAEHKLVETGPYRLLRHPSYTGTLLSLLGIGLALGNWIAVALLTLGPLPAYSYRIAVEERALRARFGPQYEAFARDRWRLIPFLI